MKSTEHFTMNIVEDKFYKNEDGNFHKEDGPAIEYANGTKYWYINGKFHREDGPAIEWANGDKDYWIHGKRLSKEQFKVILRNKKL